jgi:exonuclease SbcD
MKLLHMADWHLGRSLGGHALLEEQEHLLFGQVLAIVAEEKPDAVLIAGDVFDRAVPAAEAVELLDDVLQRIVLGLGVPVVMIPGNHDEARRLSFGAGLLRRAGLHIADSPLGRAVTLEDEAGKVSIVGAGYATPLALAQQAAAEGFADHDAAFAWLAPKLHGLCEHGARRVLVAHAFVAGGSECESERGLAVGGTGQVSAARFDGFHYVALGHLHRPQTLGGGRLRYAGSPLAYSVSEADHGKSVTLVDLAADGGVTIREIGLTPRRALRVLRGAFDALLATPRTAGEDFVALELTDPAPVPEAQRRLGEVFPRIVGLSYVALAQQAAAAAAPGAARNAAPLALFEAFFEAQRGVPLPDAARAVATQAIAAAEAEAG